MQDDLHEFSLRFNEIFPNLKPAEIARRLQTSDSVVKNYLEAKRLPTAKMLRRITDSTGVNLHWLLTGEGNRQVEKKNTFSEAEENEIHLLAEEKGVSFDEMKRRLTAAALEVLKITR